MKTGDYTTKTKNNYEFVCFYWETSNAWGHEVHLLKNGLEFSKARVRYYNRTWELYTFQSAMYEALANFEKSEIERFLSNYKLTHELKGWDFDKHEEWEKPFPRGVKAKALEEWKEDKIAKEIEELKQFVKEGK